MMEQEALIAEKNTADYYRKENMRLRKALELAIDHIEHMAAWFSGKGTGYSFESLGEDMPGIKDALSGTIKEVKTDGK